MRRDGSGATRALRAFGDQFVAGRIAVGPHLMCMVEQRHAFCFGWLFSELLMRT